MRHLLNELRIRKYGIRWFHRSPRWRFIQAEPKFGWSDYGVQPPEMGKTVKQNRVLIHFLIVSLSTLTSGCIPGKGEDSAGDDDAVDDDTSTDDDDAADDDDSTHGDDDSAGDDDTGDDDTSPPIPCIDEQDEIYIPGDYPTIQAGIEAAMVGDVVCVAPGVYTEDIDFVGKDLRVLSSHGSDVTSIQGTGQGPVVMFQTGESSAALLEGFTISGGQSPDYAGGIQVHYSSPTLVELVVQGNSGSRGGGISLYESVTVIEQTAILNNVATDWGGGLCARSSSPTLDGVTFDSNQASDGGGIHGNASDFQMTNSDVLNNLASRGAGIFLRSSELRMSNCVLAGNQAVSIGAALYATDGTDAYLYNSVVLRNGTGEATLYADIGDCYFDPSDFAWLRIHNSTPWLHNQ